MKKLVYIAVIGAALFLLTACESGGDFYIENRCSYPVYTSVDNSELVTIPGEDSYTFKIDTDTQTFLTGEVKRRVPVYIFGETFSLYDTIENVFTDSTQVTVYAGKTTSAYLAPNRASIKVVNNLDKAVSEAQIWKVTHSSAIYVDTMENIQPGESDWLRVDYSVPPNNIFSYKLMIKLEGEDVYLDYGGIETILENDEQWLLTLDPPEE